jgi:hypothetical protein
MADRYIPEHRRTQFKAKNTFKPEELRRRREEQQVEIRKAKREENLAKRRGITGGERPGASLGAEPDSDDDTAPTESQVSLLPIFFILYTPGQGIALLGGSASIFANHAVPCSLCLLNLVGYSLAKVVFSLVRVDHSSTVKEQLRRSTTISPHVPLIIQFEDANANRVLIGIS